MHDNEKQQVRQAPWGKGSFFSGGEATNEESRRRSKNLTSIWLWLSKSSRREKNLRWECAHYNDWFCPGLFFFFFTFFLFLVKVQVLGQNLLRSICVLFEKLPGEHDCTPIYIRCNIPPPLDKEKFLKHSSGMRLGLDSTIKQYWSFKSVAYYNLQNISFLSYH